MTKKTHSITFEIPEKVEVDIEEGLVRVKGNKGEWQRKFRNPRLSITKEDNKISIKCRKDVKFSKKDKMFINTYRAHIKNAFKGVIDGYTAKLKVCSGHFPINVSLSGNVLSIKNFLGEKVPRITKIVDGVKAEVKGDEIFLNGIDKDLVGQAAAKIEQRTRITNKDRRIFQDGCFITKKPGDKDE